MSAAEIVGSLLDVGRTFAWPALLLTLALVFREPIRRGVERLIEISPTGGAKFAPPAPVQIPPDQSDPLKAGTTGSLIRSDSAPAGALERFKGNVRALISDDQLVPGVDQARGEMKAAFGDSPADQIEGLLFAVAGLNVQLNHERIYQTIFGSQIAALAQMNSNFGATREALESTYNTAKANNPDFYAKTSFDQWVGFLVRSSLCTLGENGNYVLTPFGRGLLKYILDRHLSVEKPG